MKLRERIRQRKVVQWALAYLAGAWLVIQVADLVAPNLGGSTAIVRVTTVLAAAGFLVVLVLAWYHGEEGRQWASGPELLMLATLLVVAAVAVAVVPRGEPPEDGAAGRTTTAAGVPILPRAGGRVDPRSIAVLPFDDPGGDAAGEAFAAGVHDDLLTQLSGLGALRVTSRTSVRRYAGSRRTVPEIAGELGVANVLEGSVRRAGNQVRISVRLIDAGSDEPLWAEAYDRELTAGNVFAIQGEIAERVAASLHAEPGPVERGDLGRAGTESLEALDHYHAALWYLVRRGDRDADTLAVMRLERAVEIDPGFFQAWVALTGARSWLVRTGMSTDPEPARRALERAESLGRGASDLLLAQGYYAYYALGDFHEALNAFQSAAAARPGDPETSHALALIQRRLGRWDDALATFGRVVDLDPRNPRVLADVALTLQTRPERVREALSWYDRAIEIAPEWESVRDWKFSSLLWNAADTAEAREFARRSRGAISAAAAGRWAAWLAVIRRDLPAARSHLRTLRGAGPALSAPNELGGLDRLESSPHPWLALARVRHLAGDVAGARAYADSLLAATEGFEVDSLPTAFGIRSALLLYRATAHAHRGEPLLAIEDAERAVALYSGADDAMQGPVAEWQIAEVYLLAGRPDRTIETLRRVFARPTVLGRYRLGLDPFFDPLRGRPEFEALLVEP